MVSSEAAEFAVRSRTREALAVSAIDVQHRSSPFGERSTI